MAVAAGPTSTRRRVRIGPRPRPLRRALVGVAVALVLGLLWIGVRGGLALHDLVGGRVSLLSARSDLAAGHPDRSASDLVKAQSRLLTASRRTDDPVWHLASHLPFIGVDLRATHAIAAAGGAAAAASLPLVRDLDRSLDGHLLRSSDGSINLAAVSALAAPLASSETLLDQATATVAASGSGGVHPLASARTQILTDVAGLRATVEAARRVVDLAPTMLGAAGPRRYLIAFQNPAEARGTGGYLGAYAEVSATGGRLSLDTVGTDDQLTQASAPVVNVSPDFTARWRPFDADSFWGNANLTPDFPSAAVVWRSLWKKSTGQQLDGVIAVDPEAIGYLVSATGPIVLPDGTRLTGPELAAYVESDEYSRYPTNLEARRTQLRAVARDAATALTSGAGGAAELVEALSRGAAEGRVLIDSRDPAIEAQLVAGGVSGELPETAGPFAAGVVDNAGGNKMDYYLSSSVTYRSLGCASLTRAATITVTLRNGAPSSGLPLYVAGVDDHPTGSRYPIGTDRALLSIYSAIGSTPGMVTLDGQRVSAPTMSERRHPVVTLYVDIAPGQSRTVVLSLVEPAGGNPVVYKQPQTALQQIRQQDVETCPADAPLLPHNAA